MAELADLDLETIISLAGMPVQKELVNPRDPKQMAEKVRVTFRPLPKGYSNKTIIEFRYKLYEKLTQNGVHVIQWNKASEIVPDSRISKILRIRKVKRSINAVIDIDRPYSKTRKLFSNLAESIYHVLRSPNKSVTEIIKTSGWADDLTKKHVQDPFNTQVVTLMLLDDEFADTNTPYERKISIGLQNIIRTMSEVVIGVSADKISIINMNLSDSTFPITQLDDFILNSFIPKIYAPIKPPVLNRFIKGEFDPSESEYAHQLAQLGRNLKHTDLFPQGSSFSDKIARLSHRDVVQKIFEGRTGVSYGFIAIAEAPKYEGAKELTFEEWDKLSKLDGVNSEIVRQNENGRLYIKTAIREKVIYQQVPDIWVLTSRSGCDKTNLDPSSDVVRIGLVQGKQFLQTPVSIDLNRKDIRPSFDTYVILAQALSAALYTPYIIKEGMPILHFHGYPDPGWFKQNEYHAGENNPSMPCGTVEAALLNYSCVYEVANQNGSDMKLLCLVESDHGVNILGPSKEYLISRLTEGREQGSIMLGGRFLHHLKGAKYRSRLFNESGSY
jgi:hypothetical protein